MALEFLYFIEPETLILGLLFVIIFALVNWATFKSIKNSGLSAIIAFCISAISIYGIYRGNFNFTEIFYSFGFSQDLLYTVVPILIILGLFFLAKKFGTGRIFLILGIILGGLSFTDYIYEKGIVLGIGIVLILIGGYITYRKKRKEKIRNADWREREKFKAKLNKKY